MRAPRQHCPSPGSFSRLRGPRTVCYTIVFICSYVRPCVCVHMLGLATGKIVKEEKSGFRAQPSTASPSLPTLAPEPYADPLTLSTFPPTKSQTSMLSPKCTGENQLEI